MQQQLEKARSARRKGKLDEALTHYKEASRLARERGDAQLLAHTIRHLADVHQDMGNLEAAEPLYKEALNIYRSDTATSTLNLANAVRPTALLMEKLSRIEEAAPLWQEARDLYEQVSIDAGVRECEQGIERCNNSR